MKKVSLSLMVLALTAILIGCDNRLESKKKYTEEKTLIISTMDGKVLHKYYNDDVEEFSENMDMDSWEIMLDDIPLFKGKYKLSFNEVIDSEDYKKDVTVDYIIDEGGEYVNCVTYTGKTDNTYYKISNEAIDFFSQTVE